MKVMIPLQKNPVMNFQFIFQVMQTEPK